MGIGVSILMSVRHVRRLGLLGLLKVLVSSIRNKGYLSMVKSMSVNIRNNLLNLTTVIKRDQLNKTVPQSIISLFLNMISVELLMRESRNSSICHARHVKITVFNITMRCHVKMWV